MKPSPVAVMSSAPGRDIWVVYWSPLDHPGRIIARRHVTFADGSSEPTNDMIAMDVRESPKDQLRSMRTVLAGRCDLAVTRDAEDEPQIVETWM